MSLKSLIASGTTLWLDSVDPELVVQAKNAGATGATSNPIIVSDLIKTDRFDEPLRQLAREGKDDESIAWALTDRLVRDAQESRAPVVRLADR
ncbi:MAG TPA: transaldolase family protein, partial [Tepidisphaeraceae bacterium]|nr:transaldolase family protein [Tepidisphaeraceae bacterium]